ncbi:MAG: hypothetical protein AAFP00_07305 [Bacteroidota bacterium]
MSKQLGVVNHPKEYLVCRKLQVNSHKDLNDIQIYKKDRDDRRGGDRRGGGRREGRPYNGNRNRSNGSSDGYKPNKKSKKRRQKKKKF